MADFNYADEAGIIALATEIRKRIPSYAVCSTPAATAAKAIDNLTGFDLRAGATIRIKFTYGNTAPNPTLNINNTGAKEIYKHGTDKPGGSAKTSWQDESVVTMTYDGTAWFMNAYAEDVTMMEGATSTTPGTSGYVPAPAAGDQDKVLQGDGTWGVSPGVKKYPVTGTVTNTSGSYTHIFEDEHVTPDMEVDRIELGSPEVFGDKLHFVCGNGTVTMTCSEVSGTSTIKMWCQKLIVDPTAVTSTEFDILNNRLLKVENVEINYAVSVTASQWVSSENEYVYTWTNDRVENGSSVSVEFADNANSVDVDYIDVEQITGGVKLYAPWAPEDMMVNIKVTNARSKEIANITADMVATNAIATATDVEGALTRLNTTISDHGTDIDDLQDNVETLFNAGSKILPIITGTLNNSGYTINSGDYFEADGNLYKANAAIPTDESWSSSSDALTTSALSDIHAKIGNVGSTSLQSQVSTLSNKVGNVGSTDLQSQVTTLNSKINTSRVNITSQCSATHGTLDDVQYVKVGSLIMLHAQVSGLTLSAGTNMWISLPNDFPGSTAYFSPLSASYQGVVSVFRTQSGSGKYILVQTTTNLTSVVINFGGIVSSV